MSSDPKRLLADAYGKALAKEAPEHADFPVAFEKPRQPEHGDFACSIALQLGKRLKRNPRQLAEALTAGALAAFPEFDKFFAGFEIAGPGFINFRLRSQVKLAAIALALQPGWGRRRKEKPESIQVEFVSANPTGPLHVGHGRQAAIGDALAAVLESQGDKVTREFYYNDAGAQIQNLALSVQARKRGLEPGAAGWPQDGYAGEYIADIAKAYGGPDDLESIRKFAVDYLRKEQDLDLREFGVKFDVYYLESSLYTEGKVEEVVKALVASGKTYDKDGALWLRTTEYGDDKDRVVRKSDGDWTYFAADCAYYLDKRKRGFDRVVIMLGADHHGYVGRMRAMAACFGDDPDAHLEILIGQLVNLVRNGEPVRMSKRAGTVITLEDFVEALGVDATRYALARYSSDSPIDIDIELWTRASRENPVYYVQYVAARTASVARNAAEVGLTRGAAGDFRPELLTHPKENELLKALGEYPEVVASAAELREPHRVARYLEEQVAASYHRFFDNCRVLPLGDEEITDLNRARLWLNDATRTVIANGLHLLGVSAPERM